MSKVRYTAVAPTLAEGTPTEQRCDVNGNTCVTLVSAASTPQFPAPAALADNAANPTTTRVGSCVTLFDSAGANWDLARCAVQTPASPFGYQNMLPCGVYNATDPAATDGQSLPLQQTIPGWLKISPPPSDLAATATGTSGNAVTLTIPSVASKFHYITQIVIQRFAVAALTGAATPLVITTANLPGSLAFSAPADGAAIGVVSEQVVQLPGAGLKSSVVATNTTIVAPATTNVIWRVTAYYYAAT